MSAPTPDIGGFVAAQDRFRQAFGRDIQFNIPVNPVWPADTQLDPETGQPFDPTVVPSSGGGTTAQIAHVSVIRDMLPTNEQDEVDWGPSGIRNAERTALIVSQADHLLVQNAVSFELDGLTFNIGAWSEGGIVGGERWVCFGESS